MTEKKSQITIHIRKRLKELRHQKGLTQDELCFRADVSIDAISRIESGSRVPSIVTLEKITRALDISLASLFDESEPVKMEYSPSVNKVISIMEQLPEDTNKKLANIVKSVVTFHNCSFKVDSSVSAEVPETGSAE